MTQASRAVTKSAHEVVTLSASATSTATNTGTTAVRLPAAQAFAFVLDQTLAAADADDTLDVFVQTKLDGTNWVDVVHFTQTVGTGTDALRYVAKISAHIATAEFENGSALGAAAIRHLMGDEWRVRWVIVDPTGSDASFTFSVTAIPM